MSDRTEVLLYGAPNSGSSAPWVKPPTTAPTPFTPLPGQPTTDPLQPLPPPVDFGELLKRFQARAELARPEVAQARAIVAIVEACAQFDVDARHRLLQVAADLLFPPELHPEIRLDKTEPTK